LNLGAGLLALGISIGVAQDVSEPRRVIASVSGPATLSATSITVPFQSLATDGRNALSIDLSHLGDKERLYLVISEFQSDHQPGVAYDVFMNMPPNTPLSDADHYLVGNLNFFNVRSGTKTNRHTFVSFDVTAAARAMLKRLGNGQTATVTIAPDGIPSADAHPVIGRIELVLLGK
jgi:hypothetical protein